MKKPTGLPGMERAQVGARLSPDEYTALACVGGFGTGIGKDESSSSTGINRIILFRCGGFRCWCCCLVFVNLARLNVGAARNHALRWLFSFFGITIVRQRRSTFCRGQPVLSVIEVVFVDNSAPGSNLRIEQKVERFEKR
jgi:hypothetical protein